MFTVIVITALLLLACLAVIKAITWLEGPRPTFAQLWEEDQIRHGR